MAAQAQMKNVDRLSGLPDCILSHILSFLSTKEAVGTSVLSSRWRHLFTSVPVLDFYLEYKENKDHHSFISFVEKMFLFHNTGNIDKFRLDCYTPLDRNCVHRWISVAAARGVKHLDIGNWFDESTTFPSVVFTCRTLVTLKLGIGALVLDVPKGVHLPNLKTLHLWYICFSNEESFKNLLSGCFLLEDMDIWECSNVNISHHLLKRLTISDLSANGSKITIDTPNLSYFKYSGLDPSRLSLENMPSLVEADIDLDLDVRGDAMALFTGISNVRSLLLSTISLMSLLACEPLPLFPNLAQLEIRYCSYHLVWYTLTNKGLEALLKSSPELEKLICYQEFFSSLPEEVPPCLLFKLKVIEVSGFTCDENCIDKAKYILKNGGALEKMTIRTSPDISEAERLQISQVLLGSPMKAKQCCVLLLCHSYCGCEFALENGKWNAYPIVYVKPYEIM